MRSRRLDLSSQTVGALWQHVRFPGFRRQGQSVRGGIKLTELGSEHGDPVSGEFEVKILETRGGFMDRRRR